MSDYSELDQHRAKFAETLELSRQLGLEYAQAPDNPAQQMIVTHTFVTLVEAAWTIMRLQLKVAGHNQPQAPKDLILAAYDHGIIEDADAWLEVLDNHRQAVRPKDPDETQNVLDFSQTYFMELVDELAKRWGIEPE